MPRPPRRFRNSSTVKALPPNKLGGEYRVIGIKVALSGATGHMGRRVGDALDSMGGVSFVAGLVRSSQISSEGCKAPLSDDVAATLDTCDLLLDFSLFDRTLALASQCADVGRPFFVGTTAATTADVRALEEFSSHIPILYAPNVTRGAGTLFGIIETLAGQLGPSYDAKIIGVHHKKKKETPSGTSSEIARRIQVGRDDEAPPEIASLLAGDAYSNHEIIFAGHNDEIRISHNVTRPDIDQDILGAGFQWLMTKRNGFYGLPEVLAG